MATQNPPLLDTTLSLWHVAMVDTLSMLKWSVCSATSPSTRRASLITSLRASASWVHKSAISRLCNRSRRQRRGKRKVSISNYDPFRVLIISTSPQMWTVRLRSSKHIRTGDDNDFKQHKYIIISLGAFLLIADPRARSSHYWCIHYQTPSCAVFISVRVLTNTFNR